MIKLPLLLALALRVSSVHAAPVVESGRTAPAGERAAVAPGAAVAGVPAELGSAAAPELTAPNAEPGAQAAAPAAAATSEAAAKPAEAEKGAPVGAASGAEQPGSAAASTPADEAARETAARRMIEQGTADWGKTGPGDVAGAASVQAPALAKPSGRTPGASKLEPSAPETPKSEPQAPRGFGGAMLLGQFLVGTSVIPFLAGLMGIAGTTPLIVGLGLFFPGLFLILRSEPPKDAFLSFLALFGGLFTSFSLAGVLVNGDGGNAWIAGAILGLTGVGMMAADLIGNRGGSSKSRGLASWIAVAGYVAGMALMIALKDWHDGLGVLLGVGLVAVIGAGSLLLPPLFDAVAALIKRVASSLPAGPAAPSPVWAKLAGMRKALTWGGIAVGTAISAAVWLLGPSAAWASLVIGFGPMAGLFAGYALYLRARKKAGR